MKHSTTTTTAGYTDLVRRLFDSLRAIKPGWRAAFQSQAEENAAKREWLTAIVEAGISDWSTIEAALSELRQQPGPFLPSTGDFIALCRKAQLAHWRVPTEVEGFAQLQRFFASRFEKRDFTKMNPAVFAAYSRLDWGYVSGRPAPEQRQAFREVWKLVLDDIQKGRPLPKPVPPERRIEADVRPLTKEENARRLAKFRADNGL